MTNYNKIRDGFNKLLNADGGQKPFILLDEKLFCIKSMRPDIIQKGENILPLLTDTRLPDDNGSIITGIMAGGIGYSAELFKVSSDPVTYLCKLSGRGEVLSLAEKSGVIDHTLQKLTTIEMNFNMLWNVAGRNLSADNEVFNLLYRISAEQKKQHEYFSLLNSAPPTGALDVIRLCRHICERCSARLREERKIRFRNLSDMTPAVVRCSQRQTTVAVTNLIQNALMYSDRRSAPEVTVKADSDDVQICITNIVPKGMKQLPEYGMGLNYLLCYAELSGGSFSFRKENSACVAELILPIYRGNPSEIRFESGQYTYYQIDTPDYIDVMMHQAEEYISSMSYAE